MPALLSGKPLPCLVLAPALAGCERAAQPKPCPLCALQRVARGHPGGTHPAGGCPPRGTQAVLQLVPAWLRGAMSRRCCSGGCSRPPCADAGAQGCQAGARCTLPPAPHRVLPPRPRVAGPTLGVRVPIVQGRDRSAVIAEAVCSSHDVPSPGFQLIIILLCPSPPHPRTVC